MSVGNGAKVTVGSVHWYLLQLCLLRKNPPVVPPVIHLCQTAVALSTPATKTETQTSGKICFRITGNSECGTGRAALGWQAAALSITQLGSLEEERSEEGRSEVEVSSVSPSRSRINPVALLKKQKSECVTSAMSPKFLLTIKQNERAIQSHWSCRAWELPMQHWLLAATSWRISTAVLCTPSVKNPIQIQIPRDLLYSNFNFKWLLHTGRLWMRSICPDPAPIVMSSICIRTMRQKATNSKCVTWVGCVSHFHALSWEFTGTYCTE